MRQSLGLHFGTLSSFGIKEPTSSLIDSSTYFGTLSSFGIKERYGLMQKIESYFGTLSSFGIKELRGTTNQVLIILVLSHLLV